ncbi:ABC transporter ATP-binding protein [Desulfobacula sp.]|uniref:ABC transporter ATP-binding protein n=1 Tax=Desulfobacula sp. TaxID=2593537 RepID=UPI00260C9C75|nr:ABC transporter ATP-binding protein [Desulfobacula sp.]
MIVLDRVTKKFGTLKAVDDVSYQIHKGEFFALLGPNGAGKTTIIKMLLGFIRPTSGSININGVPSSETRVRKNMGYIAERHMIPPYLSGFEYLHRHASLIGLSGKKARLEVERVVELVSMSGIEKKKSAGYSKGMKQRIVIAGALIGTPDLLILDEPVSGLDPMGIRDIRNIIDSLRRYEITIVLNSHLLSEVEKTCDTAAIMHNGKIVAKDSIDAIMAHGESLEDVFVKHVTQNTQY